MNELDSALNASLRSNPNDCRMVQLCWAAAIVGWKMNADCDTCLEAEAANCCINVMLFDGQIGVN